MQRFGLAAALALALAAASSAEATQIAVRGGLETPLVSRYGGSGTTGSTTVSFADSLQPAINLMVSAYPTSVLGFDAEFRRGFAATGTNSVRQGTSIAPGVTFTPPILPLYLRAALPIELERPGGGSVAVGLRGAGGFTFNLAIVSLYLEGALDFPLAGNNVSAFSNQALSLGGGAWFKF